MQTLLFVCSIIFVSNCQKLDSFFENSLPIYVIDSDEPICKKDNEKYKMGLKNFETWALTMYDASSKFQSGILSGNFVNNGNSEQCIGIVFENIKGKHCALEIIPSKNTLETLLSFRNISEAMIETSLFWSVCVPASCSANEVLVHFQKIASQLDFNIILKLDEHHCVLAETRTKFNLKQYIVLLVLLSFLVAPLLPFKQPLNRVFSIKRNFLNLVSKNQNEIECLNGIRFLSILSIIAAHRIVDWIFFTPISNRLQRLEKIDQYPMIVLELAAFSVDTFFCLSGFLTSLGFFQTVTKFKRISFLEIYLYRYLRMSSLMFIMVLVYWTELIRFLGSGPFWYDICARHIEPCKKYWWSALIYLQNYINPEALCIVPSWYLNCEMMFCIFSPLILYPFWKNRTIGLLNWVLIYILAISTTFYLAWTNEYEVPVRTSTKNLFQSKYFQSFYITPHTRIAPFLLGLIFGYYQFNAKKIKIRFWYNILGWFSALTSMTLLVAITFRFQKENYEYNQIEASLYLSLAKSIWTLGIIWIIWACINGNGGFVNTILSLPVFRVLGSLSFSIYFVHIMVQILRSGFTKAPIHYSQFSLLYETLGDIVLGTILSFFVCLFYEKPINNLWKLFLTRKKKMQ